MGWVLVVIGAIIGLIACIDPRSVWWTTVSWQYRNPDANEPSDDVYALKRVGWVVSGLVVIGFGLAYNVTGTGNLLGVPDPRAAAVEVARQIQEDGEVDVYDGPDAGHRAGTAEGAMAEAVRSRADDPGLHVRLAIVSADDAGGVHRYTLSDGGDAAFCLTLTETGSSTLGYSLTLRSKDGTPRTTTSVYGRTVTVTTDLADGACRR